jgi:hypothetical protein
MVVRSARVALRVGLVALVPITLGCARLAPELIAPPPHAAAIQPVTSSTDPVPPRTFTPAREREEDEEIDLYGNDVSDAVAKYKLDSDGSLYELHSPETQLPHLGSSKT